MQQDSQKKLINILKEHKSIDGTPLFKHLVQTIHKLVNEPSKQFKDLELFELLSDFIKKNNYVNKKPQSDSDVNNRKDQFGQNHEWIQKCQVLIKEYKAIKSNYSKVLFPDFYNENQMLQMAGIGFGEEESQRIAMSIKKLAEESKASQIRFWGKILCSGKDYYVAEGVTSNENADQLAKDAEKKGEGANFYTFWVTHDVLGEWMELPLVTPQQIVAARQIKYVFTGDLNSNVKSYPPFNGKEKHLLKAQIVRISCACVLSPKGLYQALDDPEKPNQIELTEEPFKLPEYAELKELTNWVHLHTFLNTQGRATFYIDPTLDQEKQDALQEIANSDENQSERLKEITDEKTPYPGDTENEEPNPNWYVREYGDLQQFNQEEGTAIYGVVVLRNKTWNGHYTVCNNQRWSNIYIGYGLKTNQIPFVPPQPDDLQAEVDDTDEFPEPNHKDPPPKEDNEENVQEEQD
ncbi:hypothetical protein ABPG72_007545 [Tetrahymena utriculariae]